MVFFEKKYAVLDFSVFLNFQKNIRKHPMIVPIVLASQCCHKMSVCLSICLSGSHTVNGWVYRDLIFQVNRTIHRWSDSKSILCQFFNRKTRCYFHRKSVCLSFVCYKSSEWIIIIIIILRPFLVVMWAGV